MKHLFLFPPLLFLLFACQPKQPDPKETLSKLTYDTIQVRNNMIVALIPDSMDYNRLKTKYGETDFYTLADDKIFYENQLTEWATLREIQIFRTKSRRVALLDPQKKIESIEKKLEQKLST